MKGYDIKLRLENLRPITWRDLIIPENITFRDLHRVIQECYGFYDEHLYTFRFKDTEMEIRTFEDIFGEVPIKNPSDVVINEYFDKYKKISYEYDMGDSWRVLIEIKKKVDYDKKYPTIKRYKGDWNMIEDIGGIYRMADIIHIYENYPDPVKVLFDEKIVPDGWFNETDLHYEYNEKLFEFERENENKEEYEKKLEEFNIKFITEHDLKEEYDQYIKAKHTQEEFIDEYICKYEFDELQKFDMEKVQARLEYMFK